MTKQAQRMMGLPLGLLCLLMAVAPVSFGQAATPIPKLDLNRFTGTWYEIARYPNKREKHCIGDVFVEIALADKANRFQFIRSCAIKNDDREAINGNGRQDKSGDGKLKVSFLWPFSDKYWVLALSPNGEWALVGSPNHKNLWILSRTKTIGSEMLTEVEAKATAQGFSSAKLIP